MQLFVRNENFEITGMLDQYISLEWVKRYYETGDFVLKTVANEETVQLLRKRQYITREDDEMLCQIETVNIVTDAENGNVITATGRSVEKLLGQRIVWKQTNSTASMTAEQFIRKLIDENAINPTNPKRKIPKLKLGEIKGFSEKIEKQITGDNLLVAITEICQTYQYGFEIKMDETGEMVFDLYKGEDRSYKQEKNPYVVFSDDFENIINTEYEYDESNMTNVALIGGEGEGTARKYQEIGDSEGFERYELFVDAKDVSSNNGEISGPEYNNMLLERGKEKLAENTFVETYDGELETENTYRYKQDYNIGDVVQIENRFGMSATSRIIEVIESDNENGHRFVPTYANWESGDEGQWQYYQDIMTL